MAATKLYHIKDYNLYMGPKEVSFRTNGQGKDTANAVGDTFYELPIVPDGPIVFRTRKNFEMIWSYGSIHPQTIQDLGIEDVEITVSGPVIGHWLFLYFGTETCTTVEATPNTHTYNMATASPTVQPSFQLLMYLKNPDSGENVIVLGVGCVVTMYDEVAEVGGDGTLRGTYTIKIAKLIAGNDLTTEPTYGDTPYVIYNSTFTWTKGAVAYAAILRKWKFHFGTDKRLVKGATDLYPLYASLANKVDTYCELTIQSYETDSYDDSQDDPTSAQDKDMLFKMFIDATNYYIAYTFVNAFQKLTDMGFDEGILTEGHKLRYNPLEASSGLIILEVNDKDDDRYET
jgi:hypothetical protein